jgi:hypothetical protein
MDHYCAYCKETLPETYVTSLSGRLYCPTTENTFDSCLHWASLTGLEESIETLEIATKEEQHLNDMCKE